MQQRPLGRTGVQLSALGFGCMTLIGWYGTRNDEEARATLLSALDQGITHLDTAASYQLGENEKFVGAAIRGRRDRLFLATKYGITRNAAGQLVIDNQPGVVARGRGVESHAPGHRPHRPLLPAPHRSRDADRGVHGHAGAAGEGGQDPPHRAVRVQRPDPAPRACRAPGRGRAERVLRCGRGSRKTAFWRPAANWAWAWWPTAPWVAASSRPISARSRSCRPMTTAATSRASRTPMREHNARVVARSPPWPRARGVHCRNWPSPGCWRRARM